MSNLRHDHLRQAMKELCWFQARPLCEIMERRIPIEVGTKTDPVVWLDRLATIFRHTDLDFFSYPKPHPCQNAVTEVRFMIYNMIYIIIYDSLKTHSLYQFHLYI